MNPSPSLPPMQQLKESMRAAWMAGDFGVIAKTVAGAAVEFVNGLDVPAGARVLDVACGTGNSAIPMARRGAQVTGVDIATNLLAQGRDRAAAEGVTVAFDEGDAEQLPYGDATFDAIVTMFGAMFAPRPELVAAEFARVLKPGGLLAMANWHPSSFAGKMFQVTSRHAPPPPGLTAPVLWGDDKTVRARLGQDFEGMATEIVPVLFDMPTSPAGAVLFFRTYFGPTQMAFNRLDAAGQQALATDLENLFAGANTAMDRPDHTIVQNEFLKVTARRK